jgi:hypothetical protein
LPVNDTHQPQHKNILFHSTAASLNMQTTPANYHLAQRNETAKIAETSANTCRK